MIKLFFKTKLVAEEEIKGVTKILEKKRVAVPFFGKSCCYSNYAGT
jgi:hypothetical protein